MKESAATTDRVMRVFVSSNFRDMMADRDRLVKVVFPALREKLEKHRVQGRVEGFNAEKA